MINTYIPYITNKEKKILSNCLKSSFISTAGPNVNIFENLFKKIYGFKNAVAVNSGTSALHLALLAFGVGNNDLVITPTYTFAATANSVKYTGAEPWFFDCDKNFFLDLDKIESTLKNKTIKKSNYLIEKKSGKKVKAIIPVQTLGMKIPFADYEKFAKKYKLKIIFDSAACHDPSIFKNVNIKNSIFCFSFNGNKTLTTGAGGMLTTNSKILANKARIFSTVGKKKSNYDYQEIGFNYKMTNMQASMGIAQLKNLKKILSKKKKIFKYYNYKIKNNFNYKKIFESYYTNWVFALELKNSNMFKILKKEFNSYKIQLDYFWKPLHLQKPYKNFKHENLSFSSKLWKRILILPSHPNLTKHEQNKVCKILSKNEY